MDRTQLLQIASLVGSGLGANEQVLGAVQSGIQAEAVKKQKEEAEKKEKSSMFGKIGGTLGSLATAAIPGVGPLAAAGLAAAGGAAGSAAGQALGGGGIDSGQVAMAGATGAASSAMGNFFGDTVKSAPTTTATPPAAPARVTPEIGTGAKLEMPSYGDVATPPAAPAPQGPQLSPTAQTPRWKTSIGNYMRGNQIVNGALFAPFQSAGYQAPPTSRLRQDANGQYVWE